MPEPASAQTGYEWTVVKVPQDELEQRLNELNAEWEIFTILPVLQFGRQMMGAPVPSGVDFRIVARKPKS